MTYYSLENLEKSGGMNKPFVAEKCLNCKGLGVVNVYQVSIRKPQESFTWKEEDGTKTLIEISNAYPASELISIGKKVCPHCNGHKIVFWRE